jgi:hypothetical protein
MIGICGRWKRHRDGRIRNHPFQEEARPGLGPELFREAGQRMTLDELVQPCLLERHVDRDRCAMVDRGRDDVLLCLPGRDRIMHLDDVEIALLNPLGEGQGSS